MESTNKYREAHTHIVYMIRIYESKLGTFPPGIDLVEDIGYKTLMMSIRALYIADELIMAKIREIGGADHDGA